MAHQAIPQPGQTMKALLQPDQASKKVILTDLPIPTPKPGSDEHLVRIHTAALTNGELLWRHNFPLAPAPDNPTIFILLFDVAGTIVTSPPSSPFTPGTEIYTRTSYHRSSAGSEYTIIITPELALKPRSLSFAEAATVPMSAMTAYQALFEHAGLKPEQGSCKGTRVFVTAASGGVGVWVVQLAKWVGAEVIGTASTSNVEFVKSIGAGEVLDYRGIDVGAWAEEEGNKADVLVDCIGGKSLVDSWFVVKDGGVLVSVYQPPEGVRPEELGGKKVRDLFFVMEPRGPELEMATRGLDGGRFVPNLDSVFPLEKFEEAFDRLESGKTRGKIVIDFGAIFNSIDDTLASPI